MPKRQAGRPSHEKRLKAWMGRIHTADKAHQKWEDDFDTDELERFYEGFQSENPDEYVINLTFATIEVRLPSMLFNRPKFKVIPAPARVDDPGSQLSERARLREDTVNTLVRPRSFHFKEHALDAIKDAHFRFGICEVGYSADFLDNPKAGRPMLDEKGNELFTSDKQPVKEPKRVLKSGTEGIYIRWIPSTQFRVPVFNKNVIEDNDWCGYFEWVHKEDVLKDPHYSNTSSLRRSGKIKKDFMPVSQGEDEQVDEDEAERLDGLVKIWRIWDLRSKKRYVFAEGHDRFLVDGKKFKYHPFAVLKFHPRLNTFYPVPVTNSWMGPQKEMNETRETQRVHRQRFKRKFQAMKGTVEASEQEKLRSAEDGVLIETLDKSAIEPIKDAPLDVMVSMNVPQTLDDFMRMSGVGGDQQGSDGGSRKTATQASIVEQRSQLRETASRQQVADFIADIGRLMIRNVEDNMILPFWVKTNIDPLGPEQEKAAFEVFENWKKIKAVEFDELDYEVVVDPSSLSPLTEEQERQNWMQVFMLFSDPKTLIPLVSSPTILRKTLEFAGIRSDRDIQEFQKAGEQMLQMLFGMQQQGGQGAGGGATRPGASATNAPQLPSGKDTATQLTNQIGVQ